MILENGISIRSMVSGDLDQALRLSLAEGWNQTERDWRFLLENPANICIVAEKDGSVAGTATALNHSGKVAWIGMVVVDKPWRGMGIGRLLMTSIVRSLKHVESVKLDASAAGKPLYESMGFKEERIIYRMTNNSVQDPGFEKTKFDPVSIDPESFSEVLKLDKKIFGADRSYLLKYLLQNYPEKSFLIKEDNKLKGYILGRKGHKFNYIGPVYALTSESAPALISNSLESLNGQSVALDILEDKKDIIKWLESAGFTKQRFFSRMYLGSNPFRGIIKHQYLISGAEYG